MIEATYQTKTTWLLYRPNGDFEQHHTTELRHPRRGDRYVKFNHAIRVHEARFLPEHGRLVVYCEMTDHEN